LALVIDASVAVGAMLSRLGFAAFEPHDLVAPPLLWSEATSTIRERTWRGDIPPLHAATAIGRLSGAPIAFHRPDDLYREAWRIAERLGWAKTYDAEYIALARILDIPLLTVDGRLRATATRLIRVVAPVKL
jgi:predicted nucleic acid-binding protein